ncbi:MAG TPA: hypothetical protein DCY20_08080 [Firmicutes bacterium]|nr:hypothetical protein [Bacillota bacterium]
MKENVLRNYKWQQLSGTTPKYFKTLGHLRFEQCSEDGARSSSLLFHKPGFEKIMYDLMVETNGATAIVVGMLVKGIDVQSLKYIIHFYDHEGAFIKSVSHDVAEEVGTNYKNICVTYAVPDEASSLNIEYHINGLAKGFNCCLPSLILK